MTDLVKFQGADTRLVKSYAHIEISITDIHVEAETEGDVSDFRRQLKQLAKEIDDKRRAESAPFKEAIIEVEAPYKALEAARAKIEAMLDAKYKAYLQEKREAVRKQLEAEAEARIKELQNAQVEAAESDEPEQIDKLQTKIDKVEAKAALPVKAAAKSATSTTSLRKVLKWEVINPADIPRKLCGPPVPSLVGPWVRLTVEHCNGDVEKAMVVLHDAVRIWYEDELSTR
jgi:chromosome segregation ATPase